LQHNEVITLKLAMASIDCVVIAPENPLKLNVAEQQLVGELLCDQAREFRYLVYQRVSGFHKNQAVVRYAVDEALLEMSAGI
jgi:hypothetical protein